MITVFTKNNFNDLKLLPINDHWSLKNYQLVIEDIDYSFNNLDLNKLKNLSYNSTLSVDEYNNCNVKINNNINNNKVKPSQRSNITLNSIIVNNNEEFYSKIIKLNTDINNKQVIVSQKSNNTKKTNIVNNIHVKNNIFIYFIFYLKQLSLLCRKNQRIINYQ